MRYKISFQEKEEQIMIIKRTLDLQRPYIFDQQSFSIDFQHSFIWSIVHIFV